MRSTFTMTRAKYNKNPKLTREQWILFFKQQTIQVAMLIEALSCRHHPSHWWQHEGEVLMEEPKGEGGGWILLHFAFSS